MALFSTLFSAVEHGQKLSRVRALRQCRGCSAQRFREEVGLREKEPTAIRPVSSAVRTVGIPKRVPSPVLSASKSHNPAGAKSAPVNQSAPVMSMYPPGPGGATEYGSE